MNLTNEECEEERQRFLVECIQSDHLLCNHITGTPEGKKINTRVEKECRGDWALVIEVATLNSNEIYAKRFPFRFEDDYKKMVPFSF